MTKLFNYLLISSIFTGGFILKEGLYDFYLNYIFMSIFLLVYFIRYGNICIPRAHVYLIIIMVLISSLNLFYLNSPIFPFLKTLGGFIFYGMVYYLLMRMNNYDIERLFRIYMQLAYLVALIGIFQEISFLIGFKNGYDFTYLVPRTVAPQIHFGLLRITSIMQEPAHFGTAMLPAFFVSVLNIFSRKNYFIRKKAGLLIIISTLLTLSLVVYIGIVAVFVLLMLNYRKFKLMAVCGLVLIIGGFVFYRHPSLIKGKIDDTISVISGKSSLENVNFSTFSFLSNGFVTYKSFLRNPLFGSGLGSHSASYERYISQLIDPAKIRMALNKEDASGLFFRIISETGLLGIFLFFYFIVKFYVSRRKNNYFWIFSNAILCLFILHLLRQGNYFYGGFIFFALAYYFTYKNARIGRSLA